MIRTSLIKTAATPALRYTAPKLAPAALRGTIILAGSHYQPCSSRLLSTSSKHSNESPLTSKQVHHESTEGHKRLYLVLDVFLNRTDVLDVL